jgi:hypothetical protein
MHRNTPLTFVLVSIFLAFTTSAFAQFKYSVTTYSTPGGVVDVAIGDFNRDGLPDLEVSNGKLSFFRNIGGGKFTRRDLGVEPGGFLITADINRDGYLDLVTPFLANSAALKTLINNGDGSFRRGTDINVGNRVTSAAFGDLNRDGKVDLLAISCTTTSSDCHGITLLGSGTGTFSQTNSIPIANGIYSVALADFNRDGILDLAVSALPSRAIVYFGNGDGSFGAFTELVMDNPVAPGDDEDFPRLATADFNGDGVADIVIGGGVTCGIAPACGKSIDEIWLSDGSGGFSRKTHVSGAGIFFGNTPVPYDLNNDFKQDLISVNPTHPGDTVWYRGNGDGTLSVTSSTFNESDIPGYWPRDLNLDSRHDLIGASGFSSGLEVALNTNNTNNCPPPASDAIRAKICSPTSTASTSFQVRASGNSPAGIGRLELWVDGNKRVQTLNDQLRFNLTLSPGTHRVVVVAVDRYIGSASTVRNITVQ